MSQNKAPIYESEVHRQLKLVNSYLFNTERASFSLRLSELTSLRDKLLQQERELYTQFNVNNITELNDRIQNCKGLIQLGGSKLSSSLHKDLIDDSDTSLETLAYNIVNTKEFQDLVESYMTEEIKEIHLDETNIVSQLIEALSANRGKKYKFQNVQGRGFPKLLQKAIYNAATGTLTLATKKDEVSSEFLKRARDIFSSVKVTDSENGAVAFITPTEKNRQVYAGWRLKNFSTADYSEVQKLRKNIFNYCLTLMKSAATRQEVNSFKKALYSLPIQDLIVHGLPNLQGLIGELAAAAMMDILTGGKNFSSINLVGKEFTEMTNTQTAIDILLSHYGFQVKNYNEYALGEGFERTISLDRKNKLSTWESKFELSSFLSEALDTFYTIKGFNVQATDDYSGLNHIDKINQRLYKFYLQFPDKILRLYDDIEGFDAIKPKSYAHFYNVFWVVSGQKFIPSSTILTHIINYFQALDAQEALQGMKLETSSSYSGTTYKNIYQDFQRAPVGTYDEFFTEKAPTFAEGAANTSVTIKWQMHLDNILSNISASIV